MKVLIRELRVYLLVAITAILVGSIMLFLANKVDGHLVVNSTHSPLQDFIFTYLTHLGGGTFVIVGSLVLSIAYWKRYQASLLVLGIINLVLVAGVTQIMKQLIFYDALRPVAFIGKKWLHTAPGVEMNLYNSFPSGHTAAAFAFFAFVAYIYRKNYTAQFICGIIAILIGYSRIYLSQHFLEDAVLGGTIGLFCFVLSYVITTSLSLGKPLKK